MLELHLSELQKRYDDMRDTFERATEKHKSDYEKWMAFKAWLFSDEDEDATGAGGETRRRANFMRKKRLVRKRKRSAGNAGVIKEEGNLRLLDAVEIQFRET